MLNIVLHNLQLVHSHEELDIAFQDWLHFYSRLHSACETSTESARMLKAISERLERTLGLFVDELSANIQPKAEFLGHACHIDTAFIDIFTEEVIRGSLLFAVSTLLKRLGTHLRELGNLPSWQVISPGQVQGRLLQVASLSDVQFETYAEPSILLAEHVAGEEDVPPGVVGVLTPAAIDVLAHVAVRARNCKVMFAVCHD